MSRNNSRKKWYDSRLFIWGAPIAAFFLYAWFTDRDIEMPFGKAIKSPSPQIVEPSTYMTGNKSAVQQTGAGAVYNDHPVTIVGDTSKKTAHPATMLHGRSPLVAGPTFNITTYDQKGGQNGLFNYNSKDTSR